MRSAAGFTLVELIVGVVIISVVSTIGITSYSRVNSGANDARKKADIDSIAKAYEELSYDQATNNYRPLLGSDFSGGAIPTPPDSTSYTGLISSSASTFTVCATLADSSQYCRVAGLGQAIILNPTFTPTPTTIPTSTPIPPTVTPTPTRTPTPTPTPTPMPTVTPTPTPTTIPFPSSGLTAYWKMDEAGDTVVDHTGGDNGIAAATGTGQGKISNGRVFNGSNSRITVGNTSGVNITGSMTIAAWIKPDNADFTYRHIAIKWGEGTRQYFFARDSANKMSIWLSPNGSTNILGIRQSSSTIPANTWTHVAMTFNAGSSLNIYINGSLNNGPFSGTMPSSLYNGGAPMYLGPYPDQTWKGMMDEVGIWNRALSASEISTLYNGGAGRQP